jgi:hypothetical protein
MLAGALRGAGNVPEEWIGMFSRSALKRIRDNAGRLADLVGKRKMATLNKRQRYSRRYEPAAGGRIAARS